MTNMYLKYGKVNILSCEREVFCSLCFIGFPEIKWINMWKEEVFCGRKTLTWLLNAIIMEETLIWFWNHALSGIIIILDETVISPTKHIGAIWVLQSDKSNSKAQESKVTFAQQISFQTRAFQWVAPQAIIWPSPGLFLSKALLCHFRLCSWNVLAYSSFCPI